MGRRRILAATLALSMLCTLVLYAYSWTVNPRDVTIGEIGQDDLGAFVRIQGHVKSTASLNSGGSRIELLDTLDFARISVFVSAEVKSAVRFMHDITPGARIWVAGEVQEYHGSLEVTVTDPTFVGLISTAGDNRISLGTLAQNPEVFLGMHVVVQGELIDIDTIVDADKVNIFSGGQSLWVEYGGKLKPGGRVDVYGRLLYNEDRSRPEIKVAGGSDSILPHPSSIPWNYTVATIATILDEPEVWIGRLIAVLDVIAIEGEVIGTTFDLIEVSDGGRYVVTCMVFGWDWFTDNRDITVRDTVEFAGEWNYYAARAQWQIASGEFSLEILP